MKLVQLDPRKKKSTDVKVPKNQVTGMKIGQYYVQYQFRKLYDDGIITDKEIKLLQDKEYSKQTFYNNYEILRNSKFDIKSSDGRTRYYTK